MKPENDVGWAPGMTRASKRDEERGWADATGGMRTHGGHHLGFQCQRAVDRATVHPRGQGVEHLEAIECRAAHRRHVLTEKGAKLAKKLA
jgi:hypothetical protein